MAAPEYKTSQVKELASHLKTMGAYVQQPNPQIVGLSNYQAIGSQDAKSLYPTIMVLLNIGYDTLRGRIYDERIVKKLFNMLKKIHALKYEDDYAVEGSTQSFRSALKNAAKYYADRQDSMKASKKDFIDFTVDFYGECFRKIVSYNGEFNNILSPTTDDEYYLLKSALYPLFEAMTWISELNKGYSKIIIDHVFHNDTFDEQYENTTFYVLHEINSSKSFMTILNLEEFKTQIVANYILNPYGTYFDKHDHNKSFEVDLILGGMSDRAFVKNQMLIIEPIVQNWGKLNQRQQAAFVLDHEKLDPNIAAEVVELVGDSDPKTKKWQLDNLLSIVFDTVVTEEYLVSKLTFISGQKNSKSNSIKVTLNSGYGIYGMATWSYGNNLIANSITSGGKIYGIKLFQQIASNKLRVESEAIRINNEKG